MFSHILQVPVENYFVFLLSGLLPWIFLTQSIDMSVNVFVQYGPMIKSFRISPTVYLLSQILDNFINFIAVLLISMLPALALKLINPITLILLPIPIIILFLSVFSICWILATTQVFFRDTKFIVSFLLNILFFLTPIFYPARLLPANLKWLVEFNFIYFLITPFQNLIYENSISNFLRSTSMALGISMILFGLSWWIWHHKKSAVQHHV